MGRKVKSRGRATDDVPANGDTPPAAIVRAEHVLCFRRAAMKDHPPIDGFRSDVVEWVGRLMAPANLCFRRRTEVLERSRTYKQVVAAIVFCDLPRRRVWLYRRKGSEGRLTGLVSCLVGGHVNRSDVRPGPFGIDPLAVCWRAMAREIGEELGHANDEKYVIEMDMAPKDIRIIGIVNEDRTPVGKVHFGIVYAAWRDSRKEIAIGDLGGEPIGWTDLDAVDLDGCEPWSRYVVGHLREIK